MRSLNFYILPLALTFTGCTVAKFETARQGVLGQSVFGNSNTSSDSQPDSGSSSSSSVQPGTSGDSSSGDTQPTGGGGSSGITIQPSGGNSAGNTSQPSGGNATGSASQPSGGNATGTTSQPSGGSSTGSATQPSGGSSAGSATSPASGSSAGNASSPSSLPVGFLCSSTYVQSQNTSASTAATLEMTVTDGSGNVVCDVTSGVKTYLAANKALDLSLCNLTGNSYTVTLQDPSQPGDLFYAIGNGYGYQDASITITRSGPAAHWASSSNVSIDDKAVEQIFEQNPSTGVLWASNTTANDTDCVISASPLVVDMTPPGAPDLGMELSSPDLGILFDILGANSSPAPYTKKQISWIHNPNYMFLALPLNGAVNGIDQLFGNNTQGPDGKFAPNGFAALAKYDANGDGVIDEKDPVYWQLRLWADRNFDGQAQPSELISLSEAGIRSIDLHYDSTYFEQDQYGNQSRLRSIVSGAAGESHMIFDLWFALP